METGRKPEMTFALQLTPEMTLRLQESIDRQDADAVRRTLADALDPTVQSLLAGNQEGPANSPGRITMEEFDRLADEIADVFAGTAPSQDLDLSRAGIYGEHP